MKYSVDIRFKNIGPTQFLIENVIETQDFMLAFHVAERKSEKLPQDHFIEVTNEDGEKLATFNKE